MSICEELISNKCTWCFERKIKNANYIDIGWRDQKNRGYWPKPYQESGIDVGKAKAVVIGQDPTIEDPRPMEYDLEANVRSSRLGRFLREMFAVLPGIEFDELYFTNLVKCRFTEKPGKDNRNISEFLYEMAHECYLKFLSQEIRECANARYLFTLGRDTLTVLTKLLHVNHPAAEDFKEFYGTGLQIPDSIFGRVCYLLPLPHQPTYDLAERDSPYWKEAVRRKLKRLP